MTQSATPYNHLLPGARTAVKTCMAVQAQDKVMIFYGDSTARIAQALAHAAREQGADTALIRLEDYGKRPLLAMPDTLSPVIIAFAPTVTFYAASSEPGELAFRQALTHLLHDNSNPRHAHMPGISEQLMQDGMAVDYQQVHDLTLHVTEMLRQTHTVHITNPKGTDVTVTLSPRYRWIPSHGFYHQRGDWGNLPEGEAFTCPENVEGVVVADLLGDYFSERYGLLDEPVTFVIHEGRVSDVQCNNTTLQTELLAYLDSDPNGRRVGEFAIGTNIGLKRLIGNLLQDEKFPGMHMAFGNPYGPMTGADWEAKTHIDVIPARCTIDLDGKRLMTDGVFEPEVLDVIARK